MVHYVCNATIDHTFGLANVADKKDLSSNSRAFVGPHSIVLSLSYKFGNHF
jgi:hypothetical protein